MSVNELILDTICPNCSQKVQAQTLTIGMGYIYNCKCGWSEMCALEVKDGCENCEKFGQCYKNMGKGRQDFTGWKKKRSFNPNL